LIPLLNETCSSEIARLYSQLRSRAVLSVLAHCLWEMLTQPRRRIEVLCDHYLCSFESKQSGDALVPTLSSCVVFRRVLARLPLKNVHLPCRVNDLQMIRLGIVESDYTFSKRLVVHCDMPNTASGGRLRCICHNEFELAMLDLPLEKMK
jgi:hypothetical protein